MTIAFVDNRDGREFLNAYFDRLVRYFPLPTHACEWAFASGRELQLIRAAAVAPDRIGAAR